MNDCKILTLLTDCSFGVMVYGSSRNSGQTAFNIRDNHLSYAGKAVILYCQMIRASMVTRRPVGSGRLLAYQ